MNTVLLVIDMQGYVASRTRAGRERANPGAEDRVAELLTLFRTRGLPVVHVLHDKPGTPITLDQPDGRVLPCAEPGPDEKVLTKSTSSAFAGTGLEGHLRAAGIERIVLAGSVAAFCVTSTTRMASDLGFHVVLPGDALVGFDIPAHDGGRIDAATVLRVTLSLLGADFAQLVQAKDVAALL